MSKESTKSSSFITRAREWQRKWSRGHGWTLEPDRKEVLLSKKEAKEGNNFYSYDFNIIKAVKNPQKFNNMLRSEHIPFNMFIPLDKDKEYFKKIFNEIIGNKIKSIDLLKIEYTPEPSEKYLNDKTSFDAYIEYTSIDNEKCIIGIEVKYTEKGYTPGIKEMNEMNKEKSTYSEVTDNSKTYKDCFKKLKEKFKKNKYRQIWRNHILGESILQKDKAKFKDFISITIYPEGNKHIGDAGKEYVEFLEKKYQYRCQFLTYEKLFKLFEKHCPNEKYKKWIDYMRERYIVI